MKTIGFVSDTHGTLDPAAYAALADCDVIIHAGDIGRPSVLTELRCLAPTIAVLGNNDFPEYGSDVDYFAMPEIEGVRFLIGHEPKDVQPMAFPKRLRPGDPIPDVIVHGHVHYPRLEWGAAVRPAKRLGVPPAQRLGARHWENAGGRRPHPARLDRGPEKPRAHDLARRVAVLLFDSMTHGINAKGFTYN